MRKVREENQKKASADETLIRRPRLNRLMNQALMYPLVMLAAGAGYGKTAFARSYFGARPASQTIWLSLRLEDNDSTVFWHTFTTSAAPIAPQTADRLRLLGFPAEEKTFDQFLAYIAGLIIQCQNLTIVLDNFHIITTKEIHNFICQTVLVRLSHCNIVILTREGNGFISAGLRLNRMMFMITQDDLAFDAEESAEYLQSRLGFSLTTEELTSIEGMTLGWCQALHYTAQTISSAGALTPSLWLQIEQKAETFWKTEVLFSYDDRRLAHLTALALLGDSPVKLLGHLLSLAEAEAAQLQNMFVRRNIFTDSYTMHPLLRLHLVTKAARFPELSASELHQKAERWYQENSIPAAKEQPEETARKAIDSLSKRERELLQFMALGYQGKEIAQEMGIKITTVKTTINRIYTKLGVKNKAGAVRLAVEAQLVEQTDFC